MLIQVIVIELAFVVDNYDLYGSNKGKLWVFVLRYALTNPSIVFFLMILVMTTLSLILFFISIMKNYLKNLTMNEEYKYESSKAYVLQRIRYLKDVALNKEGHTKEKMDDCAKEVKILEQWTTFYKSSFSARRPFIKTLRLLFF